MRNASAAATVTHHQIHMGHTTKTTLNSADNFLSNMDDDYLVAYSGTTQVPDTMKRGEWQTIPLTTPFRYDASKNLALFFTGETDADNSVSASFDSSRYPTASAGSNSREGVTDTPSWDWDGIVNIKLEITK
jgi:V8-like Glu-specific endopeptidase